MATLHCDDRALHNHKHKFINRPVVLVVLAGAETLPSHLSCLHPLLGPTVPTQVDASHRHGFHKQYQYHTHHPEAGNVSPVARQISNITAHDVSTHMLPRACSCASKNLDRLPAACADSLTNEPLLFLYPRWFRNATRFPQSLTSPRKRKFSTAVKPQSRATAAAEKSDEGDHYVPTRYVLGQQQSKSVTSGDISRPCGPHEASRMRDQHTALPTRADTKWRTYDEELRRRPSQGTKLAGAQEILPKERKSSQRQSVFDPRMIDGLDLAKELACTRSDHSAGVEIISLSAAVLEHLTGTSGENLWVHHDGSGCLIHVSPYPEGNDIRRAVSLIGSARAREITSQYLRLTEKDYDGLLQPQVKDMTGTHQTTRKSYKRVDQIPRPKSWNLKAFAEHVQNIVNAQAPRGIERTLYRGEENFDKTVAAVLMELFARPELRGFQSSSALRQALEFCSKKTDVAYATRSIWSSARQAGIIPDIACFNLEIARCFRVGNSTGIAQYIREMRSTHIEPNDETWALFLRFLRTRRDRHHFMHLPRVRATVDKGQAKRFMIPALVELEFQPSDQVPEHVFDFQQLVENAYGEDWLTTLVVQSMIQKCVRAKAPQTVSKVLKLAAERLVELDVESTMSIWKAVAQTGWFEDMLLLLKMQPVQLDPVQNQRLIEFMFRAAWRCHLVNTCRVLWHYAASHGLIRHTMLAKVSRRLSNNSTSVEDSWRMRSGLVACMVGTDRCNDPCGSDGHDPSSIDDFLSELRSLTVWTPEGEPRHNQMQSAHTILERDLTAWERFEPMQSKKFIELMKQADVLDKSWEEQGFLENSSQQDLLTNAIQIELKPVQARTPIPVSDQLTSTQASVVAAGQPTTAHRCLTGSTEDLLVDPLQDLVQFSSSRTSSRLELSSQQTVRNTNSASNHPAIAITAPAAVVSLPIVDAVLHYLGLAWHDI